MIARFERRGFKLVGLKLMHPTPEKAGEHYADLKAKPFYKGLVNFFSSGPIVAMVGALRGDGGHCARASGADSCTRTQVWEGKHAVKLGRAMLGATNPAESAPGTIRGDYSIDIGRNIIHGSDSVESAKKEIEFWFQAEEVVSWEPSVGKWVYE